MSQKVNVLILWYERQQHRHKKLGMREKEGKEAKREGRRGEEGKRREGRRGREGKEGVWKSCRGGR